MDQSSFWWALFATLLFGVQHSLLASNSVKRFAGRRSGGETPRGYRFFYNIVSVVTSALLGATVLFLPDATLYRIPLPWVLLTVAIQILTGIGFALSLRQTDTLQFTGLNVFFSSKNSDEKTPLATTGFYALVRHPLYFLAFVIMWLFPLMTWNLLALFIGLTLYTLAGSLLEERRMLQEYGAEYAEYQKRTPWIIPNPFRRLR